MTPEEQKPSEASSSSSSAPRKIVKKKIIIDTDCGGDDALGILVAAADPSVEIVMLTAVWGNCEVLQGVENLGKLVDVMGKDIPIFVGAQGPLLGDARATEKWYGYGKDGFGDADFDHSARADQAVQSGKHAALAIVDALSALETRHHGSQRKEDIEIVDGAAAAVSAQQDGTAGAKVDHDVDVEVWQLYCLGPLTNIAIALQLNPRLFANLGSAEHNIPGLIVMGGAMHGKGNASLCSEFNFASDPEAARVVFNNRSASIPHLVVTWELTVALSLPWEVFDRMLGRVTHAHHKDAAAAIGADVAVAAATEGSSSFPLGHREDTASPLIPLKENHIKNNKNNNSGENDDAADDDNVVVETFNVMPPLVQAKKEGVIRNAKLQNFLMRLLKKFEETSRPEEVETGEQERTQDSCVICDAVCVAIGLNSQNCIEESNKTFATVELHGQDSRGALCIDWYGNEQSRKKKGRWVNAEIVLKANGAVINRIIEGITIVSSRD